ncbi:unnamed protein product [Linum trigynum]|uniref:CCHC-type domain-containing protein n=1 Tax=Linum trigynum TaxID=586398 RepID=A0AAV2FZD9_9ROSI
MGRGEKRKAKVVDEEAEETQNEPKLVVDLSVTDDEDDKEANEDLSLKIVEKAISKRGTKVDAEEIGAVNLSNGRSSDGDAGAAVGGSNGGDGTAELSSSSSLETYAIVTGPDGVVKKKLKKKKKVRRKEGGEQPVIIIDEEEKKESVMEGDEIGKTEAVEDAGVVVTVDPDSVEISDNIVLRKLLRGPRYFDPPDTVSWPSCYNCGEEGHMAVNCSAPRKRKPCTMCGSLDHVAKQCNKGGECYICKTRGHRARNCPEKHKGSFQSSRICLKCGESGHEMFTCRKSYDKEDLQDIQCYVCKRFGHLCCVNYVHEGENEVSCYRCGAVGHNGIDCARVTEEATSIGAAITAASPSTCYRCGEGGHFARECPTPGKTGKRILDFSAPLKEKKISGQKSAPPNLGGKSRKKSKTKSIETHSSTPKKSKRQPPKSLEANLPPTPKKSKNKAPKSLETHPSTPKKPKQRGGWATEHLQNHSNSHPQRHHQHLQNPPPASMQRGGWAADHPGDYPHHWNPQRHHHHHHHYPEPPPSTPPPYRNHMLHTASSSHYSSAPPAQRMTYQQRPGPSRFQGGPPPYHHHQPQPQHRYLDDRLGNPGGEYGHSPGSYDQRWRHDNGHEWRHDNGHDWRHDYGHDWRR